MYNIIKLHNKDNVAVASMEIPANKKINEGFNSIDSITFGHKIDLIILVSERTSTQNKKPEAKKKQEEEIDVVNLEALEDAPMDSGDEMSLISKSFPGAKVVDQDSE